MQVTTKHALFFGAGYYLGAKAGRERYEEINRRLQEAGLPEKLRATADRAKRALGWDDLGAAPPPPASVGAGAAAAADEVLLADPAAEAVLATPAGVVEPGATPPAPGARRRGRPGARGTP